MSITRPSFVARRRRTALLLTSAGLGMALATPASAECLFTNLETVICDGENGTALSVSAPGDVTVTTQPGFSVNANDQALTIRSSGALTYTDANESSLVSTNGRGAHIQGGDSGFGRVTVVTNGDFTGSTDGVQFASRGRGGMTVTMTGTVTGGSGFGIAMVNVPLANDAAISNDTILRAGSASGNIGIAVENRGANGSIDIVSTGTVTGTGATTAAILAMSTVAGIGRDIRVEASNVVGAGGGIQVINRGLGSSTAILNGMLTAGLRSGIQVTNEALARDVTIVSNGAIDAGRSGIVALNNGTGSTTVTATAQITSRNLDPGVINGAPSGGGILVVNTASGTSVSVSAAGVDGARHGIDVRSNGSGATTLVATGLVQGREGNGIYVTTGAGNAAPVIINAVDTLGTESGIFVDLYGSGDVSVTSTGRATGGFDGIRVHNRAGSGDVTVAAARASGGSSGMTILNDG
ncbi:MAG: hypothetical protein EON59_02295, partial [Alphaproteobacteria bacterium]